MKNVVLGLVGEALDRRGKGAERWKRWRPSVSVCEHEDFPIARFELLYDKASQRLVDRVTDDILSISPSTKVVQHPFSVEDPWDFESMYGVLLDFARAYSFAVDKENYFAHITTGTHVAQICMYLLAEARYIPARLLQTSPAEKKEDRQTGKYNIIDLDLSKYDQIASRFAIEHKEGTNYLKNGIATKNKAFNHLVDQIEIVAIRAKDPILITGATGVGKSHLAKRIYELKKARGQVAGRLVEVNCATLRGENAMSALFGHVKGAFTGAVSNRPGLLQEANEGILFLDEIGELGLDEQAMLLRAIEDKRFLPMGSEKEVNSEFQLIAGTNRDLRGDVKRGLFREDLLARINLWSYRIPALKERLEDLEPNIEFELKKWEEKTGQKLRFNAAAKKCYITFGKSVEAIWSANFRDLNASITRMATLSEGGVINESSVMEEIARLLYNWEKALEQGKSKVVLSDYLDADSIQSMDEFDRIQLEGVLSVCLASKSAADAGRRLFAESLKKKASSNDSQRLVQYLQRFGLSFKELASE